MNFLIKIWILKINVPSLYQEIKSNRTMCYTKVNFIYKGTKVFIYGVKFYEEEVLTSEFDLVLGVDILKSDDDYCDYLGSQVVSEAEVDEAVRNYMDSISPEVYEYAYTIMSFV